MLIRYFAGAAHAAGVRTETLDPVTPLTAAELKAELGAGRERLARVLAVSTLLVDGVPARRPEETLPVDAQVDVLPPFAGG